jgi:nucleotide-binding universal stress UspA family protein
MYQKILVPLDGSALAECTLPHVINLAKEGSIGEAVIITVSFPQNAPLEYWTPRRDEFIKYLSNIQARLDAEGVKHRFSQAV